MLTVLSVFLLSGLGCAAILLLMLRSGFAWRVALDEPNQRSLHALATPRCGGWGILPPVLLANVLAGPPFTFCIALMLLAAVSLIDDRYGASARLRFAVQIIASLLPLLIDMPMPLALGLACLVTIVWGANLYNFMDGSNGMAGSMMVAGFATYAIAALASNSFICLVSASFAGAGLGFLFFNWGKARLFLGDMGSVPAGFAMAALGVYGWREHIWPFWFPFLAFAPFVCDATYTLLKRALQKKRVWQAHREHFYQRLILSGVSHERAALVFISLMVFSEALGLFLIGKAQTIVLWGMAVEALVLLSYATLIELRWRRHLAQGGKV